MMVTMNSTIKENTAATNKMVELVTSLLSKAGGEIK
jgi:hypothetical protein